MPTDKQNLELDSYSTSERLAHTYSASEKLRYLKKKFLRRAYLISTPYVD